jgi:hypothetical protein
MKRLAFLIVPVTVLVFLSACNDDGKDPQIGTTATTTTASTPQTPPSATGAVKKESVALKINGKIKSFTESIYNVDMNGGKSNLSYSNIFTFNENGNRILLQNMRGDGKLNATTKFTYDSLGHIMLEEVFTSNGALEKKFVCKTDAAGRKIEQRDIAKHKSILNKLNYQFEYDERGNVTRWLAYKGNNSLAWNFVYTYDSNDNKISMLTKAIDGSTQMTYKYTYDDKNNLIGEEVLKQDGSVKNNFTYTYKFDRQNNWITQIKSENNKPVEIKERTYQYF